MHTNIVESVKRDWECSSCAYTRTTFSRQMPVVIHSCAGRAGLTLPMVQVGTITKVTLVEREDYIGGEHPQMLNGRPIMAATVTREDGEDRVVFAPAAVGGGDNGMVR